ncbi:hypothetical protein [Aliiruegeria lutimaris]|uniref:Glyoxalase/Bleomycin resistance protein/Dioxygenase superfamily protein n=1 Tax=Aliiruegeria lutimaris TaxID=571298 RepID=A0A1G8UL39_9RHOB|nr:hypothetical protein [Aliiruegeria lutimaris]SDJ54493.1 hypothetical protein SAMN04488026_101948 [Aliiruegeria lutimaris]
MNKVEFRVEPEPNVEDTMTDPCNDVAHLGHVEILTDKFEESVDFFSRVSV